jgi:predicted transcriptional regulator
LHITFIVSNNTMVMKYRSKSDITTAILESARSGSTKTKIMYNAYLSYSQVTEYIAFLQQNDLLSCEQGTNLYRPTEKGLRFMSMSQDLNELIVNAIPKHFTDSTW